MRLIRSLLLLAALGGSALAQAASGLVLSDPAGGYSFGKVAVGSSASRYYSFTNQGSSTLTLGQAGIDAELVTCAALGCPVPSAADFTLSGGSDGCSGKTLAPAASCSLLVVFAPRQPGGRIARLALPISGQETLAVNLAGSGSKQPDDCIFDWAEKTYGDVFSPAANSFAASPFYARCYANGLCIGFDSLAATFAAASGYASNGKELRRLASQAELAAMAGCKTP